MFTFRSSFVSVAFLALAAPSLSCEPPTLASDVIEHTVDSASAVWSKVVPGVEARHTPTAADSISPDAAVARTDAPADASFTPVGLRSAPAGSTQPAKLAPAVRLNNPTTAGSAALVAWPDAGSTGLRDPSLLKSSGSVTVTTNGAVIENLDIKGMITINANNVTVRNVRVTSNGEKYLINIATGRSGTVIEDVELNGRRITTHGIVGSGYTARRVNMYAVGDGFRAGSNTLIEDSWVHDLGHDGAHEASPHFDAVQSIGGTNITIRNNRLEGPWRGQTSAILMMPYVGLLGDVLIENNKLSGGTFTLFVLLPGEGTWGGGASAPYDPARPVTVRNNTFVNGSAGYGPLSDSKVPMKPQPYLVFDGNVYDTGGAVYPGMPAR